MVRPWLPIFTTFSLFFHNPCDCYVFLCVPLISFLPSSGDRVPVSKSSAVVCVSSWDQARNTQTQHLDCCQVAATAHRCPDIGGGLAWSVAERLVKMEGQQHHGITSSQEKNLDAAVSTADDMERQVKVPQFETSAMADYMTLFKMLNPAYAGGPLRRCESVWVCECVP